MIVLAAGHSRRMGLKNSKLTLPYEGKMLALHIIDKVSQYEGPKVIVLNTNTYEHLGKLSIDRGFRVVLNESDKQGDSLGAAVRAMPVEVEGYMCFVADQVMLRQETIDLLIDTYRQVQADDQAIVRPFYGKQPGNPVIFSKFYRENLMDITADMGGREIIKQLQEHVYSVPIRFVWEGMDIDTYADYETLLSRKR